MNNKPASEPNADPIHWRIYAALGAVVRVCVCVCGGGGGGGVNGTTSAKRW